MSRASSSTQRTLTFDATNIDMSKLEGDLPFLKPASGSILLCQQPDQSADRDECLLREQAQEGIARANDEGTAQLVSQFEVLGDTEGMVDRCGQIDGTDRV